MADQKISDYASAGGLDGTELLEVVQSSTNKSATLDRVSRITVDTFANKPASPDTGHIHIPTDGLYDLVYYDGSDWRAKVAGKDCKIPPSTGWSWVGQDTSTVSHTKGHMELLLQAVAASAQVRAQVRTAPSAPYTVELSYEWEFDHEEGGTPLVGFREGATSKMVVFRIAPSISQLDITKYTDETTNSGTYDTYLNEERRFRIRYHPIHIKLEDNNTNILFHWSNSGINYKQLHSVSRSDFFTTAPNQIVVGWEMNTADLPANFYLLHYEEG